MDKDRPWEDETGLNISNPRQISTWTGLYVDPLDMTPNDICIEDVAHALARQCRYNGHCEGFLSVARHSLWVSDELHPFGEQMQLWGLLHDAAEAYMGDLPRPFKRSSEMQQFRDAETRLEAVIAQKWSLAWPMPDEVLEADRYVLVERELPDLRHTWDSTPQRDEVDFLRRYMILTGVVL